MTLLGSADRAGVGGWDKTGAQCPWDTCYPESWHDSLGGHLPCTPNRRRPEQLVWPHDPSLRHGGGVVPLGPFRVSRLGIMSHLALGPGMPQLLPWEGKNVSVMTQYPESPSKSQATHCPGPGSLGILQDSVLPTLPPNSLLSTAKEGRDPECQGMRVGRNLRGETTCPRSHRKSVA